MSVLSWSDFVQRHMISIQRLIYPSQIVSAWPKATCRHVHWSVGGQEVHDMTLHVSFLDTLPSMGANPAPRMGEGWNLEGVQCRRALSPVSFPQFHVQHLDTKLCTCKVFERRPLKRLISGRFESDELLVALKAKASLLVMSVSSSLSAVAGGVGRFTLRVRMRPDVSLVRW